MSRRPCIRPEPLSSTRPVAALALAAAALLAACGGGGDTPATTASTCGRSLDDQKADLRAQMQANYLWYQQLQNPDPAASGTLSDWLGALVSLGDPANPTVFPKDRWSGLTSTAASNLFFVEGKSRGYGVSVAGLEVSGTTQPLRVRYVEPLSPAARAGVRRGDTIVQANGRDVSELTQAADFAWLETQEVGTVLALTLRNAAGVERSVQVVSEDFDLQPVSTATVITSPQGRRVGYLVLKDFISQATPQLNAAFANFNRAGVQDLVVDLRYNGGGLVSLSAELASLIARQAAGQRFTLLRYSDKRTESNTPFLYSTQANALSMSRVYVLTGQRTCSASELLVNGLTPFVNVVQIGGTTCGKPVGFVPWNNQCGTTVSAVNFETVNARGEGRYWDGLVPASSCAMAEDWNRPLGDPAEVLTAAALTHADTGACPAPTVAATERLRTQSARVRDAQRRGVVEPGERPAGMIAR